MTLEAPAAASTYVMTFPAATDTVAVLGTNQTFSATETFSGTLNVSGTFEIAGNAMTFPGTSQTIAGLGTAQTFTAAQTMTNSLLRLLGSSTGYTQFTSANSGASNFTITVPALTTTLVTQGDTNTVALSVLNQQAANTLLGNFNTSTGNVTASTIASLPEKASPAFSFSKT